MTAVADRELSALKGSAVLAGKVPGRVVTALLLVAVLFVLTATAVLWLRHNYRVTELSAPSPAAFARSAQVRQADVVDVSWIDDQFAAVAGRAPWLTDAGRSVLDECSVGGEGGGASYQFSCSRTDARYYAYSGQPGVRIQQLRQVLGQLGWASFSLKPSTAAPSLLPVTSADLESLSGPFVGKVGLQFSWTEQYGPVNLGQQLGAVPRPSAAQGITYIETMQPSISAISKLLTPGHPHLLIVAITAMYAARDARSQA
jgi:hypothetical protein